MMTRILTRNVWTGAVALVLGAVPLGAQSPAATAPAAVKAQAQTTPDQYIVGQAKPPDAGRPVLNLTVDQAIQRALERNLNIKVQKLFPQINDYSLQQTRAFYRPTLTGTFGYSDRSAQSTSQLEGGAHTTTSGQTFNGGVSENLKFHGASGSISFSNARAFTDSTFTTRNPSFSSGLSFNFAQPLLRNWATDSTRTSLLTQEIARQVSDIALRTSIENTIAAVRNAYWDLRAAIEAIEIAREGLAQANQLVADNDIKVQIGTMAPLDVVTAKSAAARQNVTVFQNIGTWQTRELALKALIAGATDDDAFKATINPIDKPDFTQVTPDIPAAITKALAQRTDLDQARKTLQSSEISLKLTADATKPDLSLAANYSMSGVGGPLFVRSGLGSSTITTTTPGGYFDALTSVLRVDVPAWSLTFNFTYPLGMASAKAGLARSRLTLDQSRLTLKVSELGVATDVTNAGLAVQNGYLSLQASTVARQLAEQTNAAEKSKFDVGLSTNYLVVQTLTDLNNARLAELNAMITYIKAVIEYDRVQVLGK
jgi:outer membrane protein TolC